MIIHDTLDTKQHHSTEAIFRDGILSVIYSSFPLGPSRFLKKEKKNQTVGEIGLKKVLV